MHLHHIQQRQACQADDGVVFAAHTGQHAVHACALCALDCGVQNLGIQINGFGREFQHDLVSVLELLGFEHGVQRCFHVRLFNKAQRNMHAVKVHVLLSLDQRGHLAAQMGQRPHGKRDAEVGAVGGGLIISRQQIAKRHAANQHVGLIRSRSRGRDGIADLGVKQLQRRDMVGEQLLNLTIQHFAHSPFKNKKRHLHVKFRPILFLGLPLTMQLAATVVQGPLVLRRKLSLVLPRLLIVMIIIAKCEPNVKPFSFFLHP